MRPDPWGRERRRIVLFGALTIIAMLVIATIVMLISHPWTTCHCGLGATRIVPAAAASPPGDAVRQGAADGPWAAEPARRAA